MKKFSFLSSVFLLIVVMVFLFMGCQKDAAATDENNNVPSESAVVKGIASDGEFEGSITDSYASALKENFAAKYNKKGQTLQVAFSAKDLAAFIASLQKKHGSDIIYVNFGLYGDGAPAPNPKDNGRMTVFFTGNTPSQGRVRTNESTSTEALNHGGEVPPTE